MNIKNLSLSDNYNSLSFNSAKLKAAKSLKSNTAVYQISLRDIFNQRRRKNNVFEFTYDKLLRECEELNKIAAMQRTFNRYLSNLKAIVKQMEINSKTFFDFSDELLKYKKNIYRKLIQRCTDDIEIAIANCEKEEQVDKLTSILELFIRKFGYLD